MTKVIAEIGWNHMGDMGLAEKMIKAASENGADYAKFQTWSVDRLKSGAWDDDGRRQIYEKAQLSFEDHVELMVMCEEYNIKFLSSVFSVEDAKLLVKVGAREVKIPSFECRNQELIQYCDENFDRIFMSTGTSKWPEIEKSVDLIQKSFLTLMHCVSSYPGDPEQANIKKIAHLSLLCNSVGYSDHIMGVESAKVAMAYDIDVVEKHFTIDRELPGRDNKFAILPHEMKDLADFIALYNKMHKWCGIDFQEVEKDSRENYTGRFNA